MTIQVRSHKWKGWRPDTPDYRDKRMTAQAVHYPRNSFLNFDLLPKVRNQGEQGSCTGHMARTMAMFVRAFMGQPDPMLELSPAFAYWNGRVADGTTKEDNGAEIRNVIKGIAKLGIAPEKACPYKVKSFRAKPPVVAFKLAMGDTFDDYSRTGQSLDMLRGCIHGQFPVGFGMACFDSMDDEAVGKDGLLPMPRGQNQGGHAICAVGYDDDKEIYGEKGGVLIVNSWDDNWGCAHPLAPGKGRGYFWMPYAYYSNDNLCDDGWTVRKMT